MIMNELQELTSGKTTCELLKELQFQINQGETLAGTICSHLIHNIIGKTVVFTNRYGLKFDFKIDKVALNSIEELGIMSKYFFENEIVIYSYILFPHHAIEFSDKKS